MSDLFSILRSLETLSGILTSLQGSNLPTEGANAPQFIPKEQLLTWESEGNSDPSSPYYSRRPHHPSQKSGLTIGRGYDLKMRSKSEILHDLGKAGIPLGHANLLSKAAGLSGSKAKAFLPLVRHIELTPLQEVMLFNVSWGQAEKDVIRISNSLSNIALYGEVEWNKLHPIIKSLIIDLRFRGDYTQRTRQFIQPAIAKNDTIKLYEALSRREIWRNVPESRFQARLSALEVAIR